MDTLPNADNAVIPIEKLISYSLDFDKDPNKALAFKLALGYTKKNADRLIISVKQSIRTAAATYKGNNGFGEIYESVMTLMGENGKTANVLTSWIMETGLDYPRLTNIYVTNKKATR